MLNFEEVAESVPEHFFITADGCRIFYNAEVLDPRSRNVVDYDTQTLALHRVGHIVVCPDGSKAEAVENAAELSQKLQSVLSMMQSYSNSAEAMNIPTIEFNAIMDLTSHVASLVEDGEVRQEAGILRNAKQSLKKIMSESGMSMDNTLFDYLRFRVENHDKLNYWIPELENNQALRNEVVNAIIFYATSGKTPRVNTEIKQALQHVGDNDQLKQDVVALLRDPKALREMVREAYGKIEFVSHVFSTGLLKGIESYYAFANSYEKSTRKLQDKFGSHVRQIISSEDEKNIEAIKKHIKKILHQEEDIAALGEEEVVKSVKALTSAIEGIVFDYNGHTYKLTGQFAPMNQILGIGRFDRGEGKRDDLSENEEQQQQPEEERFIAIWPGGFKPPHAGHFLGATELPGKINREFNQRLDKLYILIGNAPRAGHSVSTGRSIRITPKVSKHIWDMYFHNFPMDCEVEVVALDRSPITWIYEKLDSGLFGDGDVLFLGHGEKDSPKRFAGIDRHAKKLGLSVSINTLAVPLFSGGISGSEMRDRGAAMVDFDLLSRSFPSHLSEPLQRKVYRCMTDPENCFSGSISNPLMEVLAIINEAAKHKGFQKRLKNRLKEQHKRLLDGGRRDLVKYGKPFNQPRPQKSNAFLAQEGLKIKIPGVYDAAGQIHHKIEPDGEHDPDCPGCEVCSEPLDETSGAAGVAGFPGPFLEEEN